MVRELRLYRQRPCLKVLNKSDLADPAVTKAWLPLDSPLVKEAIRMRKQPDENAFWLLIRPEEHVSDLLWMCAADALRTGARTEAVAHAKQRKMFGQTLADFQLTQARLGEMSALIDTAAMLTYRAAWMRDCSSTSGAGTPAYTAAAASAKLTATENAQKVIDMALQLFGGRGVQVGNVVEHLYRDIRSLRIYEGASEVQLLILGKSALKN